MTETTQEERMQALRHMMDYPWDYEIDIEWAQKLIRDAEQAEDRIRELEAGLHRMLHDPECDYQAIAWDLLAAAPPPDSEPAEGTGGGDDCLGCRGGSVHHTCGCEPDADLTQQRRDALDNLLSDVETLAIHAMSAARAEGNTRLSQTLSDIRHRVRRALSAGAPEAINVVFDGPPGPTTGRFVEVETDDGRSVRVGKWIERDDGLWALRIDRAPEAVRRLPEHWRRACSHWQCAPGADSRERTLLTCADELDRALAQSEQGWVPDSVYQSATKGRADFRAALRQKRDRLAQIERGVRAKAEEMNREAWALHDDGFEMAAETRVRDSDELRALIDKPDAEGEGNGL